MYGSLHSVSIAIKIYSRYIGFGGSEINAKQSYAFEVKKSYSFGNRPKKYQHTMQASETVQAILVLKYKICLISSSNYSLSFLCNCKIVIRTIQTEKQGSFPEKI